MACVAKRFFQVVCDAGLFERPRGRLARPSERATNFQIFFAESRLERGRFCSF